MNSDLKAQLRELHITAAKEVAEGAVATSPLDAAFRVLAVRSRDPRGSSRPVRSQQIQFPLKQIQLKLFQTNPGLL